jgi:hypothetical protein
MDPTTQERVQDRPCPILFVVLPAFVAGLLWLYTMLSRVGP